MIRQSPLENQSYSNNPSTNQGRANPIFPRSVQDQFEAMGWITQDADPVRSSQAVDLKKQQVRNVVAFTLPSFGKPRKASLTGKRLVRANFPWLHEIEFSCSKQCQWTSSQTCRTSAKWMSSSRHARLLSTILQSTSTYLWES